MRAAWRLAISSLSQRPSRSVLLLLVVALSAALVCGVATAMASVTESLRSRMVGAVGTADLKIVTPASAKPLDEEVLAKVRRWPEVKAAEGRLRAAAALRAVRPVWNAGDEAKSDGSNPSSLGRFVAPSPPPTLHVRAFLKPIPPSCRACLFRPFRVRPPRLLRRLHSARRRASTPRPFCPRACGPRCGRVSP